MPKSRAKNQTQQRRPLIPPRWHIIRRLYDWILHWAHTPYGVPALALVSFVESSFFSAPPDLMLVALGLGRRRQCFTYAVIATLFSVLGAMFGYFLGAHFFGLVTHVVAWVTGPHLWYGTFHAGAEVVQLQGVTFYEYAARSPNAIHTSLFLRAASMYSTHAFLAVLAGAFFPLPFQVFTIAGGYFGIPMSTLIVATAVGRGIRFMIVAGFVYVFGPAVRRFVEKYFDRAMFLLLAVGIVAFILIKYVS